MAAPLSLPPFPLSHHPNQKTQHNTDAHRRKGCPFLLTPLALVKGRPPELSLSNHHHHHHGHGHHKKEAEAAAAGANGKEAGSVEEGGLSPLLTVEAVAPRVGIWL